MVPPAASSPESPASVPPAVLFDLDGTLLDSVGVILASYRHTLDAFGIRGIDERTIRGWIGIALEDTFAQLAPGRVAEMAAVYREHNLAHHDAAIAAYPGAAELLAGLRAEGRRIGVVTSKGRELARHGLELSGLPLPDALIGKEDTVAHKPDPEPLRLALARLGAGVEGACYVGDAVTDLRAARAAGLRAVGVSWGAASREELAAHLPDALVDDMAQLGEVLASYQADSPPVR